MQYLVSSGLQAVAQVDWMIAAGLVSMQWLGAVDAMVSVVAGLCHCMAPAPIDLNEAHTGSKRCGSYQA
jgi:hypothetical protein